MFTFQNDQDQCSPFLPNQTVHKPKLWPNCMWTEMSNTCLELSRSGTQNRIKFASVFDQVHLQYAHRAVLFAWKNPNHSILVPIWKIYLWVRRESFPASISSGLLVSCSTLCCEGIPQPCQQQSFSHHFLWSRAQVTVQTFCMCQTDTPPHQCWQPPDVEQHQGPKQSWKEDDCGRRGCCRALTLSMIDMQHGNKSFYTICKTHNAALVDLEQKGMQCTQRNGITWSVSTVHLHMLKYDTTKLCKLVYIQLHQYVTSRNGIMQSPDYMQYQRQLPLSSSSDSARQAVVVFTAQSHKHRHSTPPQHHLSFSGDWWSSLLFCKNIVPISAPYHLRIPSSSWKSKINSCQ